MEHIYIEHFSRNLFINMLTAEGFSGAGPFMHLSKHVIWSQ